MTKTILTDEQKAHITTKVEEGIVSDAYCYDDDARWHSTLLEKSARLKARLEDNDIQDFNMSITCETSSDTYDYNDIPDNKKEKVELFNIDIEIPMDKNEVDSVVNALYGDWDKTAIDCYFPGSDAK